MFAFNGLLLAMFEAKRVDVSKLALSVHSSIVEALKDAKQEEKLTVRGGKKAYRVTEKLTRRASVAASKPLKLAFLSQTLDDLAEADCGVASVGLPPELDVWLTEKFLS